jgi:hypothetical protein
MMGRLSRKHDHFRVIKKTVNRERKRERRKKERFGERLGSLGCCNPALNCWVAAPNVRNERGMEEAERQLKH